MRILLAGDKHFLAGIHEQLRKDYIIDTLQEGINTDPQNLDFFSYDLIFISSKQTSIDSYSFCSRIREEGTKIPIIFLYTNMYPTDPIRALANGADLCLDISNPCIKKINAYIYAFVRRTHGLFEEKLCAGNVTLNLFSKRVFVGDKNIILRKKEFEILEYLLLNKGKIISEETLLEHIWDNGLYVFSNTVAVHIRNIRNKIDRIYDISLIKTVKGLGYIVET